MDEADRGEVQEQIMRDFALKVRKPFLIPCGQCYNCESVIREGWIYCDMDCRNDHEKQ